MSERKAEEQRLAGGRQLHSGAGWPGDGGRPGASQHRGRHPQDGADYQEYPRAAARGSGEQTWQVSHVSKSSLSFFFFFLNLQQLRVSSGPTATALLCVLPYPSPTVFPCCHHPWPPNSFPLLRPGPVSLGTRPNRLTLATDGADHWSEAKVCVVSGTASDVSARWCPGLRRPPLPYSHSASGPLTPPPGTLASVPASQAQFSFPLCHKASDSPSWPFSYFANKCAVWRAVFSKPHLLFHSDSFFCHDTQLCRVAPLHGVDFMGFCVWCNTFAGWLLFLWCGSFLLTVLIKKKKKSMIKADLKTEMLFQSVT